MEKNYASPGKSEVPAQRQRVSMETKILLAKIGLLICIIVLIIAKSTSH
jgi:hypothetical protein